MISGLERSTLSRVLVHDAPSASGGTKKANMSTRRKDVSARATGRTYRR
jgi:hypothetical protein